MNSHPVSAIDSPDYVQSPIWQYQYTRSGRRSRPRFQSDYAYSFLCIRGGPGILGTSPVNFPIFTFVGIRSKMAGQENMSVQFNGITYFWSRQMGAYVNSQGQVLPHPTDTSVAPQFSSFHAPSFPTNLPPSSLTVRPPRSSGLMGQAPSSMPPRPPMQTENTQFSRSLSSNSRNRNIGTSFSAPSESTSYGYGPISYVSQPRPGSQKYSEFLQSQSHFPSEGPTSLGPVRGSYLPTRAQQPSAFSSSRAFSQGPVFPRPGGLYRDTAQHSVTSFSGPKLFLHLMLKVEPENR